MRTLGPAILVAAASASCSVDESASPVFLLQGPAEGAWAEWGRTAAHGAQVSVVAQRPARVLASVAFDPFIAGEQQEGAGDVLVHYQSPLVDGDDLFMEVKAGAYTPCTGPSPPADCGSAGWDHQVWTERRFSWQAGALVERWRFDSDWKPEPDGGGLSGWEPVFHAALAGDYVVVPGAGGSVFVVRRSDGAAIARVSPFGDPPDPDTYVAGPLTVAPDGAVLYHAVKLDPAAPWDRDVAGAWLVRVDPDGKPRVARFADLVPGAPAPGDACPGLFAVADLPWPPSPDAKPAPIACGSPRPGLNVAPAVAPDGTVYTVSRGHFSGHASFLVAVARDLTPRWAASLAGRLDDGCSSPEMPPTGQPGGCRQGAAPGVDPATNAPPAALVVDVSTASPVVAPDGSILYGAYTRYNHARGHLLQFSPAGSFLGAYGFGWDVTPAIAPGASGYSIVLKDNHYDVGSYCDSLAACPPDPGGPYDITQLDAQLRPEWVFTSTNTMSCTAGEGGEPSCVADHPHGFEWCINAPAVDGAGTVYANGEDGVLYAIQAGGMDAQGLFLRQSVGAAYTPLSIDAQGRIYAENFGTLFAVGE